MCTEAVGKRIKEYGVDGTAGAVHGVFDDVNNAMQGRKNVGSEGRGGVIDFFENGFCTALEPNSTVTVSDYSVITGDKGFRLNNSVKSRGKNLFEDGRINWYNRVSWVLRIVRCS